MKWIGLEWRKRKEIGEQIRPQSHFFDKTNKSHFQQKKTSIFRKEKKTQGYPSAIARWVGGAGPGPNKNEPIKYGQNRSNMV